MAKTVDVSNAYEVEARSVRRADDTPAEQRAMQRTLPPRVMDVPVAAIVMTSELQKRGRFDPDRSEEDRQLVDSVAAVGVIDPISVLAQDTDGKTVFKLLAGHRRVSAAIKAGLATVRAIVHRNIEAEDESLQVLITNMMRKDLSVTEMADTYQSLLDLGWTQLDISRKTGEAPSKVSKIIKVGAMSKTNPRLKNLLEGVTGIKTAMDICEMDEQSLEDISEAVEERNVPIKRAKSMAMEQACPEGYSNEEELQGLLGNDKQDWDEARITCGAHPNVKLYEAGVWLANNKQWEPDLFAGTRVFQRMADKVVSQILTMFSTYDKTVNYKYLAQLLRLMADKAESLNHHSKQAK